MGVELGSFIWSYVGGIGYVVSVDDPNASDPVCQVMNSSRGGGSYKAKVSELNPFLLEALSQPPTGALGHQIPVRWMINGEEFKIVLYLYNEAYDTVVGLLQTSDHQATAYVFEYMAVDYYQGEEYEQQ